jgi:hypothetical protein
MVNSPVIPDRVQTVSSSSPLPYSIAKSRPPGAYDAHKSESRLQKKHMAICYHRCRKALTAGFIQLAKEDTKTNLVDAFT